MCFSSMLLLIAFPLINNDEENNDDTDEEIGELLKVNRTNAPLLGNSEDNNESSYYESDSESDPEDGYDTKNDDRIQELVPRGYDHDAKSVPNDEISSDDESDHTHESTTDNHPDIPNVGTQGIAMDEECNENEIVSEDQGADDDVSGGIRTPTRRQDEIVIEDVLEDESADESVAVQPCQITRSRTRSGLRNIKNPPGSHRNRYEREFSYQTTGSVASRAKEEVAKARSGRFRNRWVNNKKGKTKRKKRNEMSMFVDVIMTQLS